MKTNTVIQGNIGSGKTYSFLTLLPEYTDWAGKVRRGAGLKDVLVVAMEPGYQHVFRDNGCAQGLHTHYHPPASVDASAIIHQSKLALTNTSKNIADMADPNKAKYRGLTDLLAEVLQDYSCDDCGCSFGPMTDLTDEQAICFDSLTSLSDLIRQNIIGGKFASSQQEYYHMFGMGLAFFRYIFQQTKCSVVLTSHIDREVHPVTGNYVLTVDTIGQRLAVQLSKMPDELVTAYTDDGKAFYWANTPDYTGRVVKRRALPLSDKLAPDFTPIFKDRQ